MEPSEVAFLIEERIKRKNFRSYLDIMMKYCDMMAAELDSEVIHLAYMSTKHREIIKRLLCYLNGSRNMMKRYHDEEKFSLNLIK